MTGIRETESEIICLEAFLPQNSCWLGDVGFEKGEHSSDSQQRTTKTLTYFYTGMMFSALVIFALKNVVVVFLVVISITHLYI